MTMHSSESRVADEAGDVLTVDRHGSVVTLCLSRPRKANALSRELIGRLQSELDAAESDPTVRALIIKGAGANFCAGADLSELLAGGEASVRSTMDILRELFGRLESSRLLVLASVHGAIRAGGLEIILACDVVVAAQTATFGDAHLANGLLPAGGATARLPRTIGWQRAKWLILGSQTISADTAREWGLVMYVCAEDELDARSQEIANTLSAADGETFSQAKALFGRLPEMSFGQALEAEIVALEAHSHSEGFKRGVSNFLFRKRRGAN